jgi:hypothetical protein
MCSERSSSSVGAPPACIGAVRVRARARAHKRTGVGRLAAREMELALHIHCYDILICLMNIERMKWTFKELEHVRQNVAKPSVANCKHTLHRKSQKKMLYTLHRKLQKKILPIPAR